MKARILPPEEYAKLKALTGLEQIGTTLRPEDCQVIVVEDGERVVATMGVFRVTHFESLWIDPEYRGNAGLGRRLIKAGIEAARKWATDWAWGASGTEHMDDVLERLGGIKTSVTSYMVPIQ